MIELLCTLTGIIAGVAIVASLFQQQSERTRFESKASEDSQTKIKGAADQLRLISSRVSANVNAHSKKIVDFSGSITEAQVENPERLLSAIEEIMRANASMQGQLAEAQERIERQANMIEQASAQARTDALTGLSNRRALDEFIVNCITSANENETVGLLLLDIDHFKSFNDSFGHTTGDAVLASFARSIAKACGPECYTARYGGEEFAVVLTASSNEELAEKASAIRRYISEQVISFEDLQLKITSSGGLCTLLPQDDSNSAYERADEGLYQAKKAGRNTGFFLSPTGWLPFPNVPGEPLVSAALSPAETNEKLRNLAAESSDPVANDAAAKGAPANDNTANDNTASDTSQENALSPESQDPEKATKVASENDAEEESEILDLNAFITRLEPHIQQLRRAELPATGLMVEAIGLSELDDKKAEESWKTTIALIQLNLRGIDVICQFRRHTLCVFMPGCSQSVAIDRGAKILNSLAASRHDWKDAVSPTRLAVSVANLGDNEDCAPFLDRLETALDEAHDATATQLVIHDGEGVHFQNIA